MAVPYANPAPHVNPPRSKTGPIVMIVLGVLLLLGGPLGGLIGGAVHTASQAVRYSDDITPIETADLRLDDGDTAILFAEADQISKVGIEFCHARTLTGDAAQITPVADSFMSISAHGHDYRSFARITATGDGVQHIECATDANVYVAPPAPFEGFLRAFGWWIAGGLVVALVGLGLLITGIVGLSRRSRRA
ncbi:hypothetical protein [Gordonia shandongensis]|uniref:hypothetical protein n=1 Tax=Gordonia shandongensis TaxID=376351 RepID=UPI0003F637FF|nr:hypothetical protein [Gordonia shandongensis]